MKEIRKLKEELTRAVQSEDYERAAELRDKIRTCECELGNAETADVDTRNDAE